MMDNIEISESDYEFISGLPKIHMEMLLSEINDHGWSIAKDTLCLMREAATARPKIFYGTSTQEK